MTYGVNRQWSDAFIPQIKQIVGEHLLKPAPLEEDIRQATDLLVFHARDMRIAARIRRPGYAEKYPYEITIRSRLDGGSETELSKIIRGWGDWLFYGHANSSHWIDLWWLVNLHAFRAGLILTKIKHGEKSNGDGTHFEWFDLRSFRDDPAILIASSGLSLKSEVDA